MTTLRHSPALLVLSLLAACGGGGGGDAPTTPTIPPAPTFTCSAAGVAASDSATAGANTVCMLTTQGEIVLELYPTVAPATVTNFLRYVTEGRYDNTLYHRVIKTFVIQGGGYAFPFQLLPTYAPIALESHTALSNTRGTIAMARTNVPDSATNQFYINAVDNSASLDWKTTCSSTVPADCGYAVFGKVIKGLDVVDKIAAVPVDGTALPVQPVVTYWAQKLK